MSSLFADGDCHDDIAATLGLLVAELNSVRMVLVLVVPVIIVVAGDVNDVGELCASVALLLADIGKNSLAISLNGDSIITAGILGTASVVGLVAVLLSLGLGHIAILGDLHNLELPGGIKIVDPKGGTGTDGGLIPGVLAKTDADGVTIEAEALDLAAHDQLIVSVVLDEEELCNLALGTRHVVDVDHVAFAEQLRGLVGEDLLQIILGPDGLAGGVGGVCLLEGFSQGAASLTMDLVGQGAGLFRAEAGGSGSGLFHDCSPFNVGLWVCFVLTGISYYCFVKKSRTVFVFL